MKSPQLKQVSEGVPSTPQRAGHARPVDDSPAQCGDGPGVPLVYLRPLAREELRHIDKDAAAVLLDGFLLRLARHESLCRLRLGRLATRLLDSRAYHRLGFSRLGDYTLERLGVSAREIQSCALVSRAVVLAPALGRAFRLGRLNWTKLRLLSELGDLVDFADAAVVGEWIAMAEHLTSRALSVHIKETRRSAGQPLSMSPASEPEDLGLVDGEPRVELRIRCPAHLRPLWNDVAELASRSSGSPLAGWQALEAVCAEAFSAAPTVCGEPVARLTGAAMSRGGLAERTSRTRGASGWDQELEVLRGLVRVNELQSGELCFDELQVDPFEPGTLGFERLGLEGLTLDELTPEALDAALGSVLQSMRGIDWQLGRLLSTFKRLGLHRHIGYSSMAVYADERLGISSRKVGSLTRIEGNSAQGRGELAAAYREGRLSWIRALALLPVMSERHAGAWIERAGRVTVRRLFDEVRWALDLRDRSWLFMELVPPVLGAPLERSDAEAERQMRARYDADTLVAIRARPAADRGHAIDLRFAAPFSVMALFEDVVRSYRDPHKPWEPMWKALERILLHAKAHWSGVPRHRNPIHERDGWRCRVPACSARRSLHEHHVLYRSRGGGNERGNRVSICAWHHLRAVHTGLVRAHGDAETAIHWQLGENLRFVDDVYV
jgi:hypothetical protein